MDEADQAQIWEERERAAAVVAARKASAGHEQPLVVDGVACCLGCGCAIPRARLLAVAGAARCVECEELKERENGH